MLGEMKRMKQLTQEWGGVFSNRPFWMIDVDAPELQSVNGKSRKQSRKGANANKKAKARKRRKIAKRTKRMQK